VNICRIKRRQQKRAYGLKFLTAPVSRHDVKFNYGTFQTTSDREVRNLAPLLSRFVLLL
jgi:hypothetical protein